MTTANANRFARFYSDPARRTVLGQIDGLLLCEHATLGGDGFVVVVDPVRGLAASSGFYETDDMCEVHSDYRPSFDVEGCLCIGADRL